MGVSNVTSFDTTYSIRVEQATDTEMYVGEATIGSAASSPVWRIKKLVTSASTIALLWADGNQSFDNIWDNRASISYI